MGRWGTTGSPESIEVPVRLRVASSARNVGDDEPDGSDPDGGRVGEESSPSGLEGVDPVPGAPRGIQGGPGVADKSAEREVRRSAPFSARPAHGWGAPGEASPAPPWYTDGRHQRKPHRRPESP